MPTLCSKIKGANVKPNMNMVNKMTYDTKPLLKPYVQEILETGNGNKLAIVKVLRATIYQYTGHEDWAIPPGDEELKQNLNAIDEAVKMCRETSDEDKLEIARSAGLTEYPGDDSYLIGVLLNIVFKAVNEIKPKVFQMTD